MLSQTCKRADLLRLEPEKLRYKTTYAVINCYFSFESAATKIKLLIDRLWYNNHNCAQIIALMLKRSFHSVSDARFRRYVFIASKTYAKTQVSISPKFC